MDIKDLQICVVVWANEAFPGRTPSSAFMKVFEELGEVIREPNKGDEWADLLILILDLMSMHGHQAPDRLVLDKLAINRRRSWVVNPLGVMQHKSEGSHE